MKHTLVVLMGILISSAAVHAAQDVVGDLNQRECEFINGYVNQLYAEAGLVRLPAFDIRTLPASDEKTVLMQLTLEAAHQKQLALSALSSQEFADALNVACAGGLRGNEKKIQEIEMLFNEAMCTIPQVDHEKTMAIQSDDDGYTSFD